MPVLDASVVVGALVVVGAAADMARNELRGLSEFQVPAIFTAEVTSALRGLVRREALSPVRAGDTLTAVLTLRITSYPFEPFVRHVWELRDCEARHSGSLRSTCWLRTRRTMSGTPVFKSLSVRAQLLLATARHSVFAKTAHSHRGMSHATFSPSQSRAGPVFVSDTQSGD